MKYTLRDCNNSLLLEHDDIHNCLTKAIEQTIMFPLNLSARNGNEVKTILIDNQDEYFHYTCIRGAVALSVIYVSTRGH